MDTRKEALRRVVAIVRESAEKRTEQLRQIESLIRIGDKDAAIEEMKLYLNMRREPTGVIRSMPHENHYKAG